MESEVIETWTSSRWVDTPSRPAVAIETEIALHGVAVLVIVNLIFSCSAAKRGATVTSFDVVKRGAIATPASNGVKPEAIVMPPCNLVKPEVIATPPCNRVKPGVIATASDSGNLARARSPNCY